MTPPQKYILGTAILLQLAYDWEWNFKLRKSWVKYQDKGTLKELKEGKKKA